MRAALPVNGERPLRVAEIKRADVACEGTLAIGSKRPYLAAGRFTTVIVTCDGYCFEWWTALCATTPCASS